MKAFVGDLVVLVSGSAKKEAQVTAAKAKLQTETPLSDIAAPDTRQIPTHLREVKPEQVILLDDDDCKDL